MKFISLSDHSRDVGYSMSYYAIRYLSLLHALTICTTTSLDSCLAPFKIPAKSLIAIGDIPCTARDFVDASRVPYRQN